jgi:hypothetical protein
MNGSLDVGCIFCGLVTQPTHVLLVESEELIPRADVKVGDRVLIGIIPDHDDDES